MMVTTDTIRIAAPADTPRLLDFLIGLTVQSVYVRSVVNRPHLSLVLERLMTNPDAGFFIAEEDDALVGLLVLLLYEDLISGQRRAAQVCWYVLPSHRRGLGLRLLEAGEQWATERACAIEMLAPEEKFEAFFQRRHYTPTHRVYERRLPCRG